MTYDDAIKILSELIPLRIGAPVTVRYASDKMLYPGYVPMLKPYVGRAGVVGRRGSDGLVEVVFSSDQAWLFPWWALDFGAPFPRVSPNPRLFEAYTAVNTEFILKLRTPVRVWREWAHEDLGVYYSNPGLFFGTTPAVNVRLLIAGAELGVCTGFAPFWALEPVEIVHQKSVHSIPLPLP